MDSADSTARSVAIAEETAKFQGTWRQIAHVRNGVADPPEERGWNPRATHTGNEFVVTLADGSIAIKGTYSLDPTQDPKAVDFTDTFGADAGLTFLAIYKIEGDLLTFCAANAGQERPTEFTSGAGHDLRICQREEH